MNLRKTKEYMDMSIRRSYLLANGMEIGTVGEQLAAWQFIVDTQIFSGDADLGRKALIMVGSGRVSGKGRQ